MNYFNVHQIGSQWIAAIEAPMLIADLFSKKKKPDDTPLAIQ